MPERRQAIKDWLQSLWGQSDIEISSVSGDASFRRYYRTADPEGNSVIIMDAPPEKEDCKPFIEISKRLNQAGLHAPKVLIQELEQGFLLLEDLGDRQFLDSLTDDTVQHLYGDALGALAVMQACVSTTDLPAYDEALLRFEMELFREWLCGVHLGLRLDQADDAMFDNLFEWLIINALEQPRAFVHRDYHSRNLMISAPPLPGIIDFQDAVVGPITYDLVSLLKDAYIRWPLALVDEWAMSYAELAVQSGLMLAEDEEKFQRWFDLMGLQRHIKVAGIFARLYRRDNKPGYLQDIPLVLDYILAMQTRYEEIVPLCDLIREHILPGLASAQAGR